MVPSPHANDQLIPRSVLDELVDAAEQAADLIESYCTMDAQDEEMEALMRLDAAIAAATGRPASTFVRT
jgi:hypothetical protein